MLTKSLEIIYLLLVFVNYCSCQNEKYNNSTDNSLKIIGNLLSNNSFQSKNDISSYKNVKIDCSRVSGIADGILSWFSNLQKSTSSSLKVFIKLYTRNNPLAHILINPDDNINLNSSYFNIERKSVFIIHGFMTPATESWMDHMKNAYLEYVS